MRSGGGVAVTRQQWVSDKDLIADIILGLREIAVAFGLRRHADVTRSFRHKLLIPFLIPVEEEFVLLLVETEERQPDRAADLVTLGVITIEGARRLPVVAEGIGLVGVAEVVVRVQ